jgi:ParB-like chromosome segregation protein Spo0J
MKLDELLDALEQALEKAATDDPLADRVKRYNRLTAMSAKYVALQHPVLSVQLHPASDVVGNDYNPNKVAPPEMRLLHLSMKRDGVTMPVVACEETKHPGKLVVVDGFHRTTIIKTKKDIRESTGSYIPVVLLNKTAEDRMAATVRHNIARGSHQVELSAKLVNLLQKSSWSNTRIGKELGMDPDEVLRLKQITGLAEAFADEEFSKAWDWKPEMPSGVASDPA